MIDKGGGGMRKMPGLEWFIRLILERVYLVGLAWAFWLLGDTARRASGSVSGDTSRTANVENEACGEKRPVGRKGAHNIRANNRFFNLPFEPPRSWQRYSPKAHQLER